MTHPMLPNPPRSHLSPIETHLLDCPPRLRKMNASSVKLRICLSESCTHWNSQEHYFERPPLLNRVPYISDMGTSPLCGNAYLMRVNTGGGDACWVGLII